MLDREGDRHSLMSVKPSLRHRSDIDGLRAIAVLAVVAFHATKRIPGGFVGVDVFFVISGFLISSILLEGLKRGSFSFADFYARRIRRIFPALILVLAASWLLGWYVLEPKAYASLGAHMVAGGGFFSNILLWSESGYFDAAAELKPLLHLWSLGIEEQFYLFWPLFLFFAWKGSWRIHIWIPILLGASFAINILGFQAHPVATFYLPFGRFFEPLLGAALAYIALYQQKNLHIYQATIVFRLRKTAISGGDVASLIGFLLIGGGVFALNEASSFPGWWVLLPTVGAVLLISAGEEAWVNQFFLANRWVAYIGLISYPLYLWHWPLLTFGRMTSMGIDHPRLMNISMLSLAFVLSMVTYHFVEKRVRYGLIKQSKLIVPGLGGAIIILMIVGLATNLFGGWSGRYPAAIRPFLDYKFDYKESFRNDRCLLSGAEREFADECAGREPGVGKPLMLIWGDSHGAMLYRALSEIAEKKKMSVAQYTSSSCPPVLGFEKANRPLCKSLNALIWVQIIKLRPSTVILAHDWASSVPEGSLRLLPATVLKLQQAGVTRLIIVGPVPRWQRELHVELAKLMKGAGTNEIPERMRFGLVPSTEALDDEMRTLAENLAAEYISPYKFFCNPSGCTTYVQLNNVRELSAFDDSHLMPIAAELLIKEYGEEIFK